MVTMSMSMQYSPHERGGVCDDHADSVVSCLVMSCGQHLIRALANSATVHRKLLRHVRETFITFTSHHVHHPVDHPS